MHEFSIVQALIDLCEKQAKKVNANKIKAIKIKVGRLSGIEPHFMESCFETFKEDTICNDAILDMIIIDTKIFCEDCKAENVIKGNSFFCPNCNSPETKIIEGEEMLIHSIDVVN